MILRIVGHQPQHGYSLMQEIRARSGDLLAVEEGSLYMALQRMLKEGWLHASWTTSATKRRVRVYSVTPSGAERLAVELTRLDDMLKGVRRVLWGHA
jgi:transcriptional regulator